MQDTARLDLFGLDIFAGDTPRALAALLDAPRRVTAAFVNAHCVNTAMRDPDYAAALSGAEPLLPDGSGMQLAAKMTGRRFRENLNGTDLFLPLCRAAAARGLSIYFLGGRPGVAEGAAARAAEEVPGLRIAGTDHGYFAPGEEAAAVARVNRSGADILLVALGVPRQDVWIARNRARLAPRIALGVGAQFDFWSGRVARAPAAWRRMGCEWVWRLLLEPRRMFMRYVIGNPLFVARAAKHAALWRLARLEPAAVAKRAMDIAIAAGALLALSPVFLAFGTAIRAESAGPVFFRQTRVGRDGRLFRMLKFRSMYRDAEARRAALLAASDRPGLCFKAKADPRITRIGRFLRRTSLDELPQLLNVLRGEMSIVGPRPALPEEVAAYPARARRRLAVRPGITGLWQVSGRADIGFDKMIDMDVAYAETRSPILDLVLIALTFRAVLTGRGAY
ncbi:MAG: WecB/TagA/CpsF family glycosyltransferase [Pseudomonadota bacterium]